MEKEKGMKTPTRWAETTFPPETFQRCFEQSKMFTYEYYYCREVESYNKMMKNFYSLLWPPSTINARTSGIMCSIWWKSVREWQLQLFFVVFLSDWCLISNKYPKSLCEKLYAEKLWVWWHTFTLCVGGEGRCVCSDVSCVHLWIVNTFAGDGIKTLTQPNFFKRD